jgi:hypothetical protein
MLNLPRKTEWCKEPNSQWKGRQQRLKAEGGDKPTSLRSQTSTEQRRGEAQRLRVEVGQQANLPKPDMVDHWASLTALKVVLKTELPHLAGGGVDQTVAAVGQSSGRLVKTITDLTTLHEMAVTSGPNCNLPWGQREPNKCCSQTSHLVRLLQSSHLQQTAHKTKGKNPPAITIPNCQMRGAAPFPTKPRILSVNTRIGRQRKKSRTEQTELFLVAVPFFLLCY